MEYIKTTQYKLTPSGVIQENVSLPVIRWDGNNALVQIEGEGLKWIPQQQIISVYEANN